MLVTDDARARGLERTDVYQDVGGRQWTSDSLLEKRSFRAVRFDEIRARSGESDSGQSVSGGIEGC